LILVAHIYEAEENQTLERIYEELSERTIKKTREQNSNPAN
jgi:hypothetical protein